MRAPVAGQAYPSADTTAPGQAVYPSAAQAWYAVIIFYIAYTLAFVDRQILSFLVGPIRADLGLTDFQFSLIHGFAFVVFYSTLGIPIARLADRSNRRNVIVAGVALWSAMTALCGLANTYGQLFLARLGVGFGEAALSPAAVSIMADSFPRDKRALPISIYSAGVHGGAGLASVFGGLIVAYAMTRGTTTLPLVGEMRPWQMALMMVGLPGLVVALLVCTVREPARQERSRSGAGPSFGEVFAYLRQHRVLYGTLMVGAGLAALASYGAFSWVPTLFQRHYGWNMANIGLSFGLITVVFGTGGLLLGGLISSKLAKAGSAAPYSKVMIVSMVAAAVPAALLVAVKSPQWTLGCLALLIFFNSTPIGLVQTAIQAVTPNEMRAQVIAVYLLAVALFGTALGPSAVAALTDYYFRNDAAVGSSMAIVSSAASLLSAVVLFAGVAAYRRKTEATHA